MANSCCCEILRTKLFKGWNNLNNFVHPNDLLSCFIKILSFIFLLNWKPDWKWKEFKSCWYWTFFFLLCYNYVIFVVVLSQHFLFCCFFGSIKLHNVKLHFLYFSLSSSFLYVINVNGLIAALMTFLLYSINASGVRRFKLVFFLRWAHYYDLILVDREISCRKLNKALD